MTVSRRAVLWATAGACLLTAFAVAPVIAGTAAGATLVGGCSAAGHVDSQWGGGTTGGEIVTVTVVNTSTTTATKWTVTWASPSGQQVVSAWNATVTTSNGTVTAANTAYNGTLAPAASTTFGMQLAGTGLMPALTCGNDAAPPGGSPSVTASTGGDVTVTAASNQTTVNLLVGQTLGVALGADYRPITVGGPQLSLLATNGGYPSGQPLTALYRAVAAGTVDLTTQTDYACLHTSPPCAVPITLWTVHVRIFQTPPDSGGQTVAVGETDTRKSFTLHVGDTLAISLNSTYQPTKVPSGAVLVASSITGGYPTGQPLDARYLAVALGQADVTSVTDNTCIHQPTPCPTPQIPWVVHITVVS